MMSEPIQFPDWLVALARLPGIHPVARRVRAFARAIGGAPPAHPSRGLLARSSVAASFDDDLNLMLIASALARALRAYLNKETIYFAQVGNDPELQPRLYHFLDAGLQPVGIYGGGSDMIFDASDLDQLSAQEVDLVVLSDSDPDRESKLLEWLRERAGSGGEAYRVVRLRALLEAHRGVMGELLPDVYSTCLTPSKLSALACAVALSDESGLAIEAGVYTGGGSIYISKLQNKLGLFRPILAFDTFEGIPAPTEKDGQTPFVEGLFSEATLETVSHNCGMHDVADVELVKGLVQDTIPATVPEGAEIAFALVDLDQYAGTRAALDVIVPRLARLGVIVVDDADQDGVDAAIRETLEQHPELQRCAISRGFDFLLRRDEPGALSEMGRMRHSPTAILAQESPADAEVVRRAVEDSAETLRAFVELPDALPSAGRFADLVATAFECSGKVMACGNGGSMADAMHFVEEFTGRFRSDRRGLPAIAFSDPAELSCIANDFGYDEVFARQVEAHGRGGDVLVLLSTSGNSPNLLRAAEVARERKVWTVALLGRDGGKLASAVDLPILVPRSNTSDRIQEVHMTVLHAVIEAVERRLFPDNYSGA